MTKDEALRMALEVLESERDKYLDWGDEDGAPEDVYEAITAIKQALAAQPAPVREDWGPGPHEYHSLPAPVQPVARIEAKTDTDCAYAYADGWNACVEHHKNIAPAAQRQWVGLTTEEIYACDEASGLPQHEITNADLQAFAYAIEAKLKEKNT
jgi:hypothetical protein